MKLIKGIALVSAAGLAANSLSVQAQTEEAVNLGVVSIFGSEQTPEQMAGSAHLIDAAELEKFEYTDIQRILSSVPGVSFRSEDGYGLRPNLSLRGTRDDRSGKITLMEDGVLIAPAPYSASSAYYFPTMGRINSVEVMKGASAIENGPYTIGGAINLMSTPIPVSQEGQVNLEYGADNTSRVHAWTGDNTHHYGWMVEGQKHQSDGFASIENGADDTGFDKNDLMAKFRVNTDRGATVYQQLDAKVQFSTELSDQTYVGLTEADFANDAHQRYGLTQQDQMDNEHKEITLSHLLEFGNNKLATTGYLIEFKRDWFKVDKINGDGINDVISCANGGSCGSNITTAADANAVLHGEQAASIAIKHNNRAYESKGIQSKLVHSTELLGVQHEIEVGLRYHQDSEDRHQPTETWTQDANGNLNYVSTGTPSTRFTEAKAWSAYISDDIVMGSLLLSPGVRYEDYKIEREGSAAKTTDQQVTLFGLGATYQINNDLALFSGLHEGHSPAPNDGVSDPEEALNFELGARFTNKNIQAESTLFVSDYSNLLGTCTASGGADECTIGDTSNGGAALVQGLELLLNSTQDLGNGLQMPLGLTYTYTDAKFENTFSDNSGVWGDVSKGDKLPNLSDNQIQLRAGLGKEKWAVNASANYYSATCATAACNAGEDIEAYTVIDVASRYQFNARTKLYANIDNLLNSENVVARAPKNGARAQKPLSVIFGVNYRF